MDLLYLLNNKELYNDFRENFMYNNFLNKEFTMCELRNFIKLLNDSDFDQVSYLENEIKKTHINFYNNSIFTSHILVNVIDSIYIDYKYKIFNKENIKIVDFQIGVAF